MPYRRFLIVLFAGSTLLASCGEKPPPKSEAQLSQERVREKLDSLAAERRYHDAEDERNKPFTSSLRIESLGDDERMRLCGPDYRSIAVGWPIKKALACAGTELYVVSEAAGGMRVWQHCYSTGRGCLTVGEQNGYVVSWNR